MRSVLVGALIATAGVVAGLTAMATAPRSTPCPVVGSGMMIYPGTVTTLDGAWNPWPTLEVRIPGEPN